MKGNEPMGRRGALPVAIAGLRRQVAMSKGLFSFLTVGLLVLPASVWAQVNACDLVEPFGTINGTDVQAAIDMAFGVRTCPGSLNIAGSGVCNVVVVQRVINAALGKPCSTPLTHGVTLTWAQSSSTASYNIYRSTAHGDCNSYPKVGSTAAGVLTYDDGTATVAGQIYYYVVKAVDNGSESACSTEVSATIPTP
jgi:hypothetical protein